MTDAPQTPDSQPDRPPDWEAFYSNYRKPGYVPGYEITSKLGGGAFGLVFRARKESIGKDYAIKFLKVDDAEVRRAVYGELEQVRYFAQVDHPNLVQIEDRGEVDGIPFLLMQFAGSETLRDRIVTDAPPTAAQREELLALFLQACRGVAALHERSLVHFDLKPANVFIKGSVARVGDYGLSKLVTHSRGSLTMGRGTPYYMAPEILQRRGDQRSDIYSLGVMLYELLCGQVPFTGESEWEVLRKHESDEPEWPRHLAAGDREVLQRCLHKDPDRRYRSVDELIAALAPAGAARGTAVAAAALQPPPLPAALTPPPLPAGTVPSCVPPLPAAALTPPPLPAAAATPPPLPKRRRRNAALSLVPTMLVLVAVFFVFSGRFGWRDSPSTHRVARAAQSRDHPRRMSRTAPSVAAQVDEFVKEAQRSMRRSAERQREPRLSSLAFDEFDAPRDIRAYVHMVEHPDHRQALLGERVERHRERRRDAKERRR